MNNIPEDQSGSDRTTGNTHQPNLVIGTTTSVINRNIVDISRSLHVNLNHVGRADTGHHSCSSRAREDVSIGVCGRVKRIEHKTTNVRGATIVHNFETVNVSEG